jgi:transposase
VSKGAVEKIWKQFKEGGIKALKQKKRGLQKSHSPLSDDKVKLVCGSIKKDMPGQHNIPRYLWTAVAVRLLIKKAGVNYSVRYTRKLLKHWGFTFQKPAFSAYEQDRREVKKWLEETYSRISAKAQRQKGRILWADELGLHSQHTCGNSYGPKGKTPVLQKSGKRFYLNMLTAMSNLGHLLFMVAAGNVNMNVYLQFLQKLLRSVKQKIFLITDSHPVHLGKAVGEWLWAKRKRQKFFICLATARNLIR